MGVLDRGLLWTRRHMTRPAPTPSTAEGTHAVLYARGCLNHAVIRNEGWINEDNSPGRNGLGQGT